MAPKLTERQLGWKEALMYTGIEEAEAERRALELANPSPKPSPPRTFSHVEIPVTQRKRKADSISSPSPSKRRQQGNRGQDDDEDLTTQMSKMRAHSTSSIATFRTLSTPSRPSSSSKRRMPSTYRTPSTSKTHSPTPSTNPTLNDDDEPYVDLSTDYDSAEEDSSSFEEEDRPSISNSRTGSSSVEKKADFGAVLTPIVHRTVRNVFRNEFKVGLDLSGRSTGNMLRRVESHYGNPELQIWGKFLQKEEDRVFYKNVTMDGEVYKVNDVVLVQPGHDSRQGRKLNYQSEASQSVNKYANNYWFIQISYFFHDCDTQEKMFHGRWLEHGSKTCLQEVAHSRGLFLTNTCADEPLTSIFQKVDVKFFRLGEPEPEDDEDPEGDSFFCPFVWDPSSLSFVDLHPLENIKEELQFTPSHRHCHSCVLAEAQEAQCFIQHTKTCISQFGKNYHVFDCIYVAPGDEDDGVLGIAQIIAISNPTGSSKASKLTVRMFQHVDNCPNSSFVDDRLLDFSTDRPKTIPFSDVCGKAYVKDFCSSLDAEQWTQHEDHFYILTEEISQCSECMEEHEEVLAKMEEFCSNEGNCLRGLELFCGKLLFSFSFLLGCTMIHLKANLIFPGAGGLGTGLNASKFVKTIGAVEWDKDAAETYKRNHPDTTVYCQEINEFLQHLIDSQKADGNIPPLRSRWGGDCEALPKPGEIDLISGGPPCQAFSGANHNPQADDIRATLPFTMISLLEIYQARYFLLENVVGIMHFRLMGEMGETKHSIVAGIKHGVFKLIVRSLLALGYQVRVKVLQAANYGAPQGRQRVIFWGAAHGNRIPDFPIPTHVYSAKEYKVLEHDLKLSKPTRSLDPENPHSFAPFKAVTVNDAIGDLAPFDWKNPHEILAPTAKEREEARIREKVIPSFSATRDQATPPGFAAADYLHEPVNWYQKSMRANMMDSVEEHVTPMFDAGVVERSTMVPLRPGAHHHMLPRALQQMKKSAKKNIHYGRLNSNGQFGTVMTHSSPSTKGCSLLHPSQKRSITVREVARSQGFPDNYTFMTEFEPAEVRRAYKQIGNAVPVPLALALGKSLGQAVVADWESKQREGSPEA